MTACSQEETLSSAGMKPEDLAKASQEMEEAEKAMNDNEQIIALKSARKDFQTMMDNVNQILRLVITGRIDDEQPGGGCGGNCSSCGGCH